MLDWSEYERWMRSAIATLESAKMIEITTGVQIGSLFLDISSDF